MLFFVHKYRRPLMIISGSLLAVGLIVGVACKMHRERLYGVNSSAYDRDESVAVGSAPQYLINKGEMGGGTASASPTFDGGVDIASGRGGVAISPMPPMPYPPTAGPTAAEVDQKIIKLGALSLTVDSVTDTIDRITSLAVSRKGFVQTTSLSERPRGSHDGVIVIRVPSSEFESTMREIKSYAKVVNNETSSGQDVTEQYSDMQAQLRNAQAQETEYLNILKKATKVEEILSVQSYLGSVRAQIESLQGRIKYLENVTAFSTIEALLTEELVISLPTREFRPMAIIREAVQSLIAIGQDVIAAVIWIVIVGGGIAIPVAIVVLVVRAILRARAGRRDGSSGQNVTRR